MLDALLNLPPWAIFTVSTVPFIVLCLVIVPLVVRKRIDVGAGGLEMLNPLLNFLCYAFTLLLAFVMINVWSEQVAKMETFGNEVLYIEESVIAVKIMDAEALGAYKQHVVEYLDMVELYELEQKPPVGGAPQVNEKFDELLAMVNAEVAKMAERPEEAGEAAIFFDETEAFFNAREERVNHAPLELDGIFVGILLVLGLLTVLCVLLMPATSAPWLKYAQSLSVAVPVGLMLGLILYVASNSFTALPEEHQLARIEAVIKAE